jgi:hypothetical protein
MIVRWLARSLFLVLAPFLLISYHMLTGYDNDIGMVFAGIIVAIIVYKLFSLAQFLDEVRGSRQMKPVSYNVVNGVYTRVD